MYPPRTDQLQTARTGRFSRPGAIPASLPAEVLDAIGAATDVYDQLLAGGRQVHFDFDLHSSTGKLTIQVLDTAGNLLSTVSPHELLHVAAGAPLA